MKLTDYFKTFLTDTVNLMTSKLDDLDDRVPAITDAIKGSTTGTTVLDAIPQGSWAHRTIIQPGDGFEFDADFLIQLDEVPDWATTPHRYNDAVWNVLSNHGTYGKMTTRKNRCVRVTYANDCHIDVVPYVVLGDGREVIVNRTTDTFEDTNPIAFTEWLQERDQITGGDLRKVIRLMKYLRDHCGAFDVKSILLTTVMGERVETWRKNVDEKYYAAVPTTLVHVVEDLDEWLQLHPTKPSICDPSCPSTTFDHRWTDKQYETFRDKIHTLAGKMRDAYDEPDKTTSLSKWQALFGLAFKAPATTTASAAPVLSKSLTTDGVIARGPRAPYEEFIDDRHVNLTHTVTVECEVSEPVLHNRQQRRAAKLHSRRHHVPPGRALMFRIVSTDVPAPFDVRWKVRNRGFEAKRRGQERGQIRSDNGNHRLSEHTSFTGPHYVECYILKGGDCVAAAHVPVNIDFNA